MSSLEPTQMYWKLALPVTALVVALAVASYFYVHRKPKLTEKDSIVVGDFTNTTGDPVFDDSLKQGLAAQLEQSPFLNLLSDERIAQTLSLMAKSKGIRLTREVAREVCQRTGSTAVLDGSISQVGTEYLLTVKALNCANGEVLASANAQASDKNHVLDVLGNLASNIRSNLGESLASVRKYDTLAENVTTPSLDALNAFSRGVKARYEEGDTAAIPFYRQAIEFDPTFAMAYLRLGLSYGNLGEATQSNLFCAKAFALRGHVSARESFNISSSYYDSVLGDLLKADDINNVWAQTFPEDPTPLDRLGNDYLFLGQYDKALDALLEERRRARNGIFNYGNLVAAYINLDQLDNAQTTIEESRKNKTDTEGVQIYQYIVDFLRGDPGAVQHDSAAGASMRGIQDTFLQMQSDTEAYSGHRQKARSLSEQAAELARGRGKNETAATYYVNEALREAELGDSDRAIKAAQSALALAPSRDVETLVALVFARTGFAARAKALSAKLASANPANTVLNGYWLPTIRAAIELNLNHPSEALVILQSTAPQELGAPPPLEPGTLYPVFVRGQAYIGLHRFNEASREFQKILHHPGCVMNFVFGALAHLELGRAYVLSGDRMNARRAYEDFLTLWKDADPDIPILKEAKAEYAKLQ